MNELPARSPPPSPATTATPASAMASPASCGGRRRARSSQAENAAANSGVVAFSTEASAEVMRSSPQAIEVNGITLMDRASTARWPHQRRSGRRSPPP